MEGEAKDAMVAEVAAVTQPVPASERRAPLVPGAASLPPAGFMPVKPAGRPLVVPTVAGIVVFTAGPIVASFALSLFRWNVITAPSLSGYPTTGH